MTYSAIVAIVGKSNVRTEDRAVLDRARVIGRAMAAAGHIVLTGGHIARPEESVKHYALLGAVDAAADGQRVRIVGVMPGLPAGATEPFVEEWQSPTGDGQGRFLHTNLSNQLRDEVNGGAPDVVVALAGKSGTPKEVAAAIAAGRTVIYLDSYVSMRPRIAEELRDLGVKLPAHPIIAADLDDAIGLALKHARLAVQTPPEAAGWTVKYPKLAGLLAAAIAGLRAPWRDHHQ